MESGLHAEAPPSKLEQLYQLKYAKLAEQRRTAETLHNHLAGPEGLMENTRRTLKNLDAAVVASKRPGYFKYHEPTPEVRRLESTQELSFLVDRVKQIERELAALDGEIDREEARARAELGRGSSSPSSLDQWFRTYGKPKAAPSGMMSEFAPSPKVWGGTQHHQAFKSVASVMKRGRLTR